MAGKIIGEVEKTVCRLYAESVPPKVIAKRLKENGLTISWQAIYQYINNPRHTNAINTAVEKNRADPMTIDIANKKVRLADMSDVRMTLVKTMERLKNADGEILEKKIGKYLGLAKRLVEIEIQAREEIEKKPEWMAFWEKIGPYSALSDEDLRKTEKELEGKIVERRLLIGSGPLPGTAGSQGVSPSQARA